MHKIPLVKTFVNRIGHVYGLLTVINYAGNDGKCNSLWECKCVCGNVIITRASSIRRGKTTSCGCAQKDAVTKHSMLSTPTYITWNSMKQRCLNPNAPNYYLYGGRNIAVCKRWLSFENFFEDMGKRPSRNHSIDRWPNNDGNYEPGNCRWATAKEQNRNKRGVTLVEIDGKNMAISEAAEIYGIKPSLVYDRLRLGWDIMEALKTPKKR